MWRAQPGIGIQGRGFLGSLFVRNDLRGRGVGRTLLEAILSDASGRATFASSDPRALPLYVRFGMRPITPDGLPIIGKLPGHDNVFVATGHSMLGITLAPVTAALVADLAVSGRSGIDHTPFDPSRFL